MTIKKPTINDEDRVLRILEKGDMRASRIFYWIRNARKFKKQNLQRLLANMVDKGLVVIVRTEAALPNGSGPQAHVYGLAGQKRVSNAIVQNLLLAQWPSQRVRYDDEACV